VAVMGVLVVELAIAAVLSVLVVELFKIFANAVGLTALSFPP